MISYSDSNETDSKHISINDFNIKYKKV